ncbi:hypothetical protein FQN60_018322, partial [Etheostoma spectabile]
GLTTETSAGDIVGPLVSQRVLLRIISWDRNGSAEEENHSGVFSMRLRGGKRLEDYKEEEEEEEDRRYGRDAGGLLPAAAVTERKLTMQ